MNFLKNRKIGLLTSYILLIVDCVIGIFYTPMLISALGAVQYGLYDLVNSLSNYIAVADLGLGATITRYIIKYHTLKDIQSERNSITTALHTYSLLAGISILVSIVITILFPIYLGDKALGVSVYEAQMLLIMMSGNIVLSLYIHAFAGISLAYSYYSFEKILKLGRVILRFIMVLLIVTRTGSAIDIALIDISLTTALLIAYILFFRHIKIPLYKGHFKFYILKDMLFFTSAIFFQSIINQISMNAGRLIIGWKEYSMSAIANFSIMSQIYLIYSNMSTVIQNIYYPSIGQAVFNGENAQQLTYRIIEPSRLQGMILYSILIGFWIFGRDFISLWVGSNQEIDVFKIWAMAAVIMTSATLFLCQNTITCILKARNILYPRTKILAAGVTTALLMAIVLVSFMDAMAAVVLGICFSNIIFNTVCMNIYYARCNIIKVNVFWKAMIEKQGLFILLSIIIALLIKYIIPNTGWISLIVQIGAFSIAYMVVALTCGINHSEKNRITIYSSKIMVNLCRFLQIRH